MAYRTKPFSLRFPITLLAQVDARCKEVGLTRTQWFEKVAIHALKTTNAKVTETKEYRI